jgi:hypothetical protein
MNRRRQLERAVADLLRSDPARARAIGRAIAEADPNDEQTRRLVDFIVAAHAAAEGDAATAAEGNP